MSGLLSDADLDAAFEAAFGIRDDSESPDTLVVDVTWRAVLGERVRQVADGLTFHDELPFAEPVDEPEPGEAVCEHDEFFPEYADWEYSGPELL